MQIREHEGVGVDGGDVEVIDGGGGVEKEIRASSNANFNNVEGGGGGGVLFGGK